MKRIIYEGKNKYYFEEKELCECSEDMVEVRVRAMGLCGSDLHKFLRQTPNHDYLKTKVLGHEIMGVVSNKGKNCLDLEIGDRVVINPFDVSKGHEKCQSFSLTNDIKIVGRDIDGGYSEVIYVPKNCVYKLSDTISDEEAIFIDDIAVLLHGFHYAKEIVKNVKDIAIIGDGPLGLLSYKILSSLYEEANILLFAKNQDKLKKFNFKIESFDNIHKYSNCFDLVIEAVGGTQADTLNGAIKIGKNNFLILCFGVFQFNYEAKIDVRTLFYKQGMLKGINSYCNFYNDFDDAIDLLERKKIKVADLITNEINFDNAIDYIRNYDEIKNNIKTIFKVME